MDPIAAFVYSNSSVLVDKYNPLGTILVSLFRSKKGLSYDPYGPPRAIP